MESPSSINHITSSMKAYTQTIIKFCTKSSNSISKRKQIHNYLYIRKKFSKHNIYKFKNKFISQNAVCMKINISTHRERITNDPQVQSLHDSDDPPSLQFHRVTPEVARIWPESGGLKRFSKNRKTHRKPANKEGDNRPKMALIRRLPVPAECVEARAELAGNR